VTDYGYRYVGIRSLGGGRDIRSHLPLRHALHADPAAAIPLSWTRATAGRRPLLGAMDDEHCMVWNWMYSWGDEPFTRRGALEAPPPAMALTTSNPRYLPLEGQQTQWLVNDRQCQRPRRFTGIEGINAQDRGAREHGPHCGSHEGVPGACRPAILVTTPSADAGGQNGEMAAILQVLTPLCIEPAPSSAFSQGCPNGETRYYRRWYPGVEPMAVAH